MKKNIMLFSLVIFPIISGCRIGVEPYIRNLTNEVQEIRITLKEPPHKPLSWNCIEGIKEPGINSYHKQNTPTIIDSIGSNTYIIKLPAMCTLFLNPCVNFYFYSANSILINNVELLNDDGTFKELYSKKRTGITTYIIWYDIK